ncbi:MAG: glycosyltransferase family 2 protein [Chloroflexi bacterium]|nr:glycosyltransferase family 2 protein [Chloroflexota bacterium]
MIIVNWNGRTWLETCLPALAAQTHTNFETIVVDNGSEDNSILWIKKDWPHVHVLALEENWGFAKANNIGIQAARGEYIATLNNDTVPEPEWLEALVTAVSSKNVKNVGMAASLITLWQYPSLLDSAGIEVDKAGIAWNRGYGQIVSTALKPRLVFGPSASAALYSKQMLDEIGLFDESYFAYYEDVDLAWRAQRYGWRCQYTPAAKVKHWHSATGEQTPALKLTLLGKNKLLTILKNYPWPQLLWYLPLIFLFDTTAVLVQTLKQKNRAALNGRYQAVKAAKKIIQTRQPSKSTPPLTPISLRRYLFRQR